MFLPLSKKSRRLRKGKGARHHAKAKAKNRRRINGMARRALGSRIGRAWMLRAAHVTNVVAAQHGTVPSLVGGW